MTRPRPSEDAVHTVGDDLSTSKPRAGATPVDGVDLASVRAWARSRGYPIDECAGVPPSVLRTYRLVHAGCGPGVPPEAAVRL